MAIWIYYRQPLPLRASDEHLKEMKAVAASLRFAAGLLLMTAFWIGIYLVLIPIDWRLEYEFLNPGIAPKWLAILIAVPSAVLALAAFERAVFQLPSAVAQFISKRLQEIDPKYGCLSAMALVSLLVAGLSKWSPSPLLVSILFAVIAAGGILSTLNRAFSIHRGQRNGLRKKLLDGLVPPASELLRIDPRPPILYLRSFSKELERATAFGKFINYRGGKRSIYFVARSAGSNMDLRSQHRKASPRRALTRMVAGSGRSSLDQQMIFAEFFHHLGPYVAIGRPGEGIESMDLGASKLYVSDSAWQKTVLDLIEASAAIVIEAGDSKGLQWEIEHLTTLCDPRKVLIILPKIKSEYRSFCKSTKNIFPRAFPDDPAESRLVMFDEQWTPIELKNPSWSVEDALKPFYQRLRLAISKPSWFDEGLFEEIKIDASDQESIKLKSDY